VTASPGDPCIRFSNRVGDYRRFRPGYPPEVLDELRRRGALPPGSTVADVGSGTGIFTRLLLEDGHAVYAIEPNPAMRAAAEEDLRNHAGFHSVDGSAEATTLGAASVDLVAAAQAFHWFDVPATRGEFARILRPGGAVALLWNERLTGTPFLEAYEQLLLRTSLDYTAVDHRRVTPEALSTFFGPGGFAAAGFSHAQHLDREGLRGRLTSSSYVPAPDHPGHAAMLRDLDTLFNRYALDGRVDVLYETKLYVGRLT
jgi:SAM-dependent methyltransferase